MVIFKRRCLASGGFGRAKPVFAGDFPATADIAGGCVADHFAAIECEGGHNEWIIGLTKDEARQLRDTLNRWNF
jgi:hypothetical protein